MPTASPPSSRVTVRGSAVVSVTRAMSPRRIPAAAGPRYVLATNLNGDDYDDLVVANYGADSVMVSTLAGSPSIGISRGQVRVGRRDSPGCRNGSR